MHSVPLALEIWGLDLVRNWVRSKVYGLRVKVEMNRCHTLVYSGQAGMCLPFFLPPGVIQCEYLRL